MIERETDVSFVTEIWEKESSKTHARKIEELLELRGIKYISTPRRNKRGGGAAIIVNLANFTLSKLNVHIPKQVEAVWGLLKPKSHGKHSSLVVCCFYSPPNMKRNTNLVNHLMINIHSLLNIHKGAGVILCGDRNNIEIPTLVAIDPSLRQIVSQPTYELKTLDVMCTNLSSYFQTPFILPPLQPDNPLLACPSDHSGVQVLPITNGVTPARTKVVKYVRPLPDSSIAVFRDKLGSTDFYLSNIPVDDMVAKYQDITINLLKETFPEKRISFSSEDKPWYTEELRLLKRQKLREYDRRGKNDKYKELQEAYDSKLGDAVRKYTEKMKIEVLEGKRGSVYPVLKRLGERPNSDNSTVFNLPEHLTLGLSSQQSADLIADYFSKISQEYHPLQVTSLPQNIISFLATPDLPSVPRLSVYATMKRIIKAKKPLGIVPGDLPRKLVQKTADLIAIPASVIFNTITSTSSYPSCWKIERQVAIPKTYPPEDENDLRNIAKTPFLSKVYESFLAEWLLIYIRPYLDPNQCGMKGLSITHYLIKLLHFIHSSLDMKKPHAVLAACIDLSKAFNRVDHSLVIQDLYDMKTPPWLLRIVVSYLSSRTMTLTYKGAESGIKELPAGTPQGAFMGGLIFMIKVNGIFLRPSIPRIPLLSDASSVTVEYVDDATAASRINLKTYLVPDNSSRPRPLNFRERCQLVLPSENNPLQYIISEAEKFTKDNKMLINKNKTQVIMFSRSRTLDFPPELTFEDGSLLKVVSEMKLLGVYITEDLKWKRNTDFIVSKAKQKIWIIRRLIQFKLSVQELFDVYNKEIRSILEFAVPVWHSGLTRKQSASIESVQKLCFKLILRHQYTTYLAACNFFSTDTLQQRRRAICLKFAKKNIKGEHSFFTFPVQNERLRPRKILVNQFRCNTAQFERSSLPFLASLLNAEG